MGYVLGFASGHSVTKVFRAKLPEAGDICLPDNGNTSTLVDAVELFLSHGSVYGFRSWDAGEFLDLPSSVLTYFALAAAYPCEGAD